MFQDSSEIAYVNGSVYLMYDVKLKISPWINKWTSITEVVGLINLLSHPPPPLMPSLAGMHNYGVLVYIDSFTSKHIQECTVKKDD